MRPFLFMVLVATAASASAQSSPSAGQQALGWLQTQWTRVQKEGRPAAERVVRQFPGRFRDIKAQVVRMTEVAGQMAEPQRFAEKRELLMELWRVRGSLNLLALCSPDLIHQITGLDTSDVASLEAQLSRARDRISKA